MATGGGASSPTVGRLLETPSCLICLESYSNVAAVPKLLLCGHTSCEKCIVSLMKSRDITCPKCRKTTRNIDSVDALPTNYDLLEVINLNKELLKAEQRRLKAGDHCATCNGKSGKLLACLTCTGHLMPSINFTSKDLICLECWAEKHNGHTSAKLDDVKIAYEEEIDKLKTEIQIDCFSVITERTCEVNERMSSIHHMAADVILSSLDEKLAVAAKELSMDELMKRQEYAAKCKTCAAEICEVIDECLDSIRSSSENCKERVRKICRSHLGYGEDGTEEETGAIAAFASRLAASLTANCGDKQTAAAFVSRLRPSTSATCESRLWQEFDPLTAQLPPPPPPPTVENAPPMPSEPRRPAARLSRLAAKAALSELSIRPAKRGGEAE